MRSENTSRDCRGQNCRAIFLKVTDSAASTFVASGRIVDAENGQPIPNLRLSYYPMLGLYAAVTRQTTNGKPDAGWFPDERISIQDAIRAYTYNTAYANFEETIKGSIEAGKLADLTVLSKNLLRIQPKEILTAEVVYTIVNGKIVYQRSGPSRR